MHEKGSRRINLPVVGLLVAAGTVLNAGDMSGTWHFVMKPDFRGNAATVECTVEQRQSHLTLKCGSGVAMTGQKRGRRVTFITPSTTRDRLVISYKAEANDSATIMEGTWQLTGPGLEKDGKFTATKQK